MKKGFLVSLAASLAVTSALTVAAHADFAKTKTYTDGQFTDVPASEWYAASVKDAFEFGIMNGNSATTFGPNGTLTVAEGITIASRINETLTGVKIPAANGGEWYQVYVDYAIANGIMTADQFDSYDINIKRFEISELLAKVAGNLPALNSVDRLPDVASGADYAEAVLKLYNAGILGGNDEYGTFAPNSYLLRSEISAMAVRIADSTKRVKKEFVPVDARAFTDSYYIIENTSGINNGWGYDNRFEFTNDIGETSSVLRDASEEQFYATYRDFKPESEGVLRLEHVGDYSTDGDKGPYIAFLNANEERIFEFTPVGGVWQMIGENAVSTSVKVDEKSARFTFVVEIDLDKNTATAVINNVKCGTVNIKKDAVLTRLAIGTNKEGKGAAGKVYTRMSKNYPLDENFIVNDSEKGQKPALWDITGDFVIDTLGGSNKVEGFNLKADSKAGSVSVAKKNYEAVTGKVVFECNMLLPQKTDGASVSVTSGGKDVFKFETKNGKIVMGETELHDYIPNVWQWLYVEADTVSGKAVVKINGKEKATVSFDTKSFDGVTAAFAPSADAKVYFDDFEVYTLVDHADYPSYPAVSESTDYNVGLNVCYLWRDLQSAEGWDATSPFPEFDTYLGFYDEGLRETADWELKWMAEHGIDFIHVCWYGATATAPVKKMPISHSALHDGYMNAKYSDLVDFCIMWENAGATGVTFEQFKTYIWPYWKEYYFSDDRYVRLDNKALITIWDSAIFKKTCGGTNESVKEAVAFMEEELKAMGYDGLILLDHIQNPKSEAYYKGLDDMDFDGSYAYHWERTGWSADYQISCNDKNAEYAKKNSHHIPTISVGFNDIGRNDNRNALISGEDHLKVAEHLKGMLDSYKTGTWMDNTVMISTWNEYSEGTYIMPTDELGFTYLENIRKTFTNDTSDHTLLDAKPTETQLARVGHMYAPNRSPIRRFKFENADTEGAENPDSRVAVRTYDMAKGGADAWENFFGMQSYSEENGVIAGSSNATDYGIKTTQAKFVPVPAADAPILHIRMKVSDIKNGELYFITDVDPNWSDSKRAYIVHTKKDEFVDYYLNMSSNPAWKGNITAIRLDPSIVPASFEISLIEFMNYAEAASDIPVIKVNGKELAFAFHPEMLSDGDYKVVGEPSNGFYSMLRLYYEWDRFTDDGVLTLKSFDEHTYVLKVNSDKVLVDGVQKSLGFTFTLRDGLPVFHIKKFLDVLGYKYTVNGKTLEVQAATEKENEVLNEKNENWWEFTDGTDGFTIQHGSSILTDDGFMAVSAGNSDVAIIRKVDFNASDYSFIVVGIEYNELLLSSMSELFFTTKESPGLSASKVIVSKADMQGKKPGDVVEIVFNLSSNHMFTGNVDLIRIDPYSGKMDFKVDYVRCIKKGASLSSDSSQSESLSGRAINLATELAGVNVQISEQSEERLAATAANADPNFTFKGISFNADDVKQIHIRMRSSENSVMQVYFATDTDGALSESKTARVNVTAWDDFKDYYIDVSSNSLWKGRIIALRLDPLMVQNAEFVIELIELL